MTRTSHRLIGVGIGILLTTITLNPLAFIGAYAGSTFPDVDYKWGFHKGTFSHRGITHSLLLGLILFTLGFVVYIVFPLVGSLGLGFGAGYISHLLADAMSPTGIPSGFSYYPRFRLRTTYKTGTWKEYLISFLIFSFLLGIGVGVVYFNKDFKKDLVNRTQQVISYLNNLTKI